MKKVGLFGGSFDPIHSGHIKLALHVLKECELDEVWFILAYDQPLKDKHFESFEHRAMLIDAAIAHHPQLKLITIEEKLEKPSYSYNTVKALKEEYPTYDFMWIIGSDNVPFLDQWYRIDDLKAMIEFIVVSRNNDHVEGFKVIEFQDDASSTAVRSGQFMYLDEAVRHLILENHMYMNSILFNNLSEKRANHVLRCVDVGLEIAKYHDFDLTQVYEAIVLHDITKELSKDVELELMIKHFGEHMHYHHKVFHQFTGAYIAKEQYMIDDEAVTNAIMHHTTGTDDAPLSKLVYIADKVERGRPYEVEEYIALAKKDLDDAFALVKHDAEASRKEGK